jgi:hypothetical protein
VRTLHGTVSQGSVRVPRNRWREIGASGFWLLVPILAFNLAFAGKLPPEYQMDTFRRDIPAFVAVPENVLRVAVMFVPALMPIEVTSRAQRVGLIVYVVGVLVYFGSWALEIAAPASAWSRSAIGFLGPSWTPVLWFAGITLIGERLYLRRLHYRRWMYAALVAGFLGFHNLHAAIVYLRTR